MSRTEDSEINIYTKIQHLTSSYILSVEPWQARKKKAKPRPSYFGWHFRTNVLVSEMHTSLNSFCSFIVRCELSIFEFSQLNLHTIRMCVCFFPSLPFVRSRFPSTVNRDSIICLVRRDVINGKIIHSNVTGEFERQKKKRKCQNKVNWMFEPYRDGIEKEYWLKFKSRWKNTFTPVRGSVATSNEMRHRTCRKLLKWICSGNGNQFSSARSNWF